MTTRAQGWFVSLNDGRAFAFTDHDENITIGPVTYLSSIGFVPSAIDRNTELTAANQQLSGIIDNDLITQADLRSGAWDGARVDIIEIDWKTETQLRKLMSGFLGEVSLIGIEYSVVLNSIESELQKPIGRTVKLKCDADLGDSRCGLVITPEATTVTTVNSLLSFDDSALAEPDSIYNGGKIEWLTGNNAGTTFDVKRFTAGLNTVQLYEPVPYPIQVGDTANIYQGCDKTIETCRDIFANAVRFKGFPYLPGVRAVIGGTVKD